MLRAFYTWDPVSSGTYNAFNEPAAYANNKWFFDKSVWQKMFRAMSGCGFDALILANTHPFPFMIDLARYPDARIIGDPAFMDYQRMHHWIFETALDYDIASYVMFFNIYMPAQLLSARGIDPVAATVPSDFSLEYTHHCVRELLENYSEVTGFIADVGSNLAGEIGLRTQFIQQAKTYAKMQAIATLAEEARGTIIDYTSKGHGYMADTFIKQEIKGVLGSIRVVATSKRSEGKDIIVAVTIRAPKPVVPKVIVEKSKEPTPAKTGPSWVSDVKCSVADGQGYTSVIINAQGLKVQRTMSPKILRPDGSEVWGTVKTDYDFVAEYGIVAYTRNIAEAISSRRAGDKPLIIRALSRGPSPNNGDVVISTDDARFLADNDRKSHFLDDFRVIVVVDAATTMASTPK